MLIIITVCGGDFLTIGLKIFQPSSSPPAQALAWALAYLADYLTTLL